MANESGTLTWNPYIRMRIIKAGNNGLRQLTQNIYTLSQQRVPLDDGELSTGARMFSDDPNALNYNTAVSYGNSPPSSEYAVIQHENLSYRHKTGQAKFLESAFLELESEALNYIGYSIRSVL